MDFAIGQENSVLNLPDRQGKVFWGENSNYRKTVINPAHQNSIFFWTTVKLTFGQAHASYSLKLTFFAPHSVVIF